MGDDEGGASQSTAESLLSAIASLEETAEAHAVAAREHEEALPELMRRVRKYPNSPDVKRIEALLATRAELMSARRDLLRDEALALRRRCQLAAEEAEAGELAVSGGGAATPRGARRSGSQSVAVAVAHRVATLLVVPLAAGRPSTPTPLSGRRLSYSSGGSPARIAPASPSSFRDVPASPAKAPVSPTTRSFLALTESETKDRIAKLRAKQAEIEAARTPRPQPLSPKSMLALTESETKDRIAKLRAKHLEIVARKAAAARSGGGGDDGDGVASAPASPTAAERGRSRESPKSPIKRTHTASGPVPRGRPLVREDRRESDDRKRASTEDTA